MQPGRLPPTRSPFPRERGKGTGWGKAARNARAFAFSGSPHSRPTRWRPCRSSFSRELFHSPDRIHKARGRSEEHTSELQSLMRISYAVFCLKKKTKKNKNQKYNN